MMNATRSTTVHNVFVVLAALVTFALLATAPAHAQPKKGGTQSGYCARR
jgi:hypothetical protein